MQTTKISTNIKPQYCDWLYLVCGVKRPHGAAGNNQLQPLPTSPDVFSITGRDHTSDLRCLTETWHKADSAVLGHLCGAAYNVVDSARPHTADDLLPSVNHGGVAIVTGADIALLLIDIADPPTMFEIVFARAQRTCPCRLFRCNRRPAVPARLTATAATADILWRTGPRCWSSLNLTLCLCIVSYRVTIFCVISYCIVSFSLRAVSCQH